MGIGTIRIDNPRLTTRLVKGKNPDAVKKTTPTAIKGNGLKSGGQTIKINIKKNPTCGNQHFSLRFHSIPRKIKKKKKK